MRRQRRQGFKQQIVTLSRGERGDTQHVEDIAAAVRRVRCCIGSRFHDRHQFVVDSVGEQGPLGGVARDQYVAHGLQCPTFRARQIARLVGRKPAFRGEGMMDEPNEAQAPCMGMHDLWHCAQCETVEQYQGLIRQMGE